MRGDSSHDAAPEPLTHASYGTLVITASRILRRLADRRTPQPDPGVSSVPDAQEGEAAQRDV